MMTTRFLARRLDRLRHRLHRLASRVRDKIAEALGRSAGGLLRDTVLYALDRLAAPTPVPAHRAHPDSGLTRQPAVAAWAGLRAVNQPSRPWTIALVNGLRAATWLLPGRGDRRGWLTAVAVAVLLAALSACSPAAAAGLTLLAVAQSLGVLVAGTPVPPT